MNLKQVAAVLALGAVIGGTSRTALEAAFDTKVQASSLKPTAHAVDLRRPHGSAEVRVMAYATRGLIDGGVQDLGQAISCVSPVASKKLGECMDIAAAACDWR